MPYPKEVDLLSETHFVCGSGHRRKNENFELDQEYHKSLESTNCLMEYANLYFGSKEDYNNRELPFDGVWDSVPKKVYQTIREAIIEVYGPKHVGIYEDDLKADLVYEIQSEVADIYFEDSKSYLEKVGWIVSSYQCESELDKTLKKEIGNFIESGSIPSANDDGCSIKNAKVWNLAMKKLGYG